MIHHINRSKVHVVAIDIPSGLFGEDNRDNNPENIVRANYTVTFQFPFLSFFFADNARYTGEWIPVPIGLHPQAIEEKQTPYTALDMDVVKPLIKDRGEIFPQRDLWSRDDHRGELRDDGSFRPYHTCLPEDRRRPRNGTCAEAWIQYYPNCPTGGACKY